MKGGCVIWIYLRPCLGTTQKQLDTNLFGDFFSPIKMKNVINSSWLREIHGRNRTSCLTFWGNSNPVARSDWFCIKNWTTIIYRQYREWSFTRVSRRKDLIQWKHSILHHTVHKIQARVRFSVTTVFSLCRVQLEYEMITELHLFFYFLCANIWLNTDRMNNLFVEPRIVSESSLLALCCPQENLA